MATLCFVVAVYGICFGAMTTFTGLFVGAHILIAGFAHIIFGIAYMAAGIGMLRHRAWASPIASACSFFITIVGSYATYESFKEQETANVLFWSTFALVFLCLTFVSWFSVKWNFRFVVLAS
jgi:hypothetical protein